MERIGRFRIESRIGEGAMGVVYLATDPRLERPVALKVYRLPQGLDDQRVREFRERFLREARAAGRLTHPGIVTVYDAGEDRGRDVPFIAMEYVPGTSLQALLEREGPLPPERTVPIAVALAEALHAAHEAGIVHRDVKPANVLIRDQDGAVKIADFGVARVGSSTLTSSGASIGSPAYMSPEQIRGAEIDGRSDLFSLAVIAYEMLCGRRPFGGEDPTEVLYAVAHQTAIEPSRIRPELPLGLDRFFEIALAKEREARFADGPAMARALEQAVRERDAPTVEATMPEGIPAVAAPAPPLAAMEPAALGALHGDHDDERAAPWRRRAVVVAVLLGAVLAGWLLFGRETTYLKLDARSGVTSGELTLLVDGRQVYSRDLAAPADQQGFLKRVTRKNRESFEALIEVEPGTHEVTARVAAPDGGDDYHSAIVVDFEKGETQTIKLSAGRMFGSALSMKSK